MIKADLGFFKVLPSLRDLKESFWPMIRGTVIGFFIGIFPGAGPTISSFISYGVEQRISRNPEQFGKGAVAGVAGPETANNAATGGAMVPMLSLGLPSSPSTAIMLAALIMFGLKPGPSLFREAPQLVWGLIGSMYIGNVLLVVINLACIPLIVLFMDRIRAYLPLAILLLSAFGVYSYRNSVFDIGIMLLFAVVGYGLRKIEFPAGPGHPGSPSGRGGGIQSPAGPGNVRRKPGDPGDPSHIGHLSPVDPGLHLPAHLLSSQKAEAGRRSRLTRRGPKSLTLPQSFPPYSLIFMDPN